MPHHQKKRPVDSNHTTSRRWTYLLRTIMQEVVPRMNSFVFPPLCIVCDTPRPNGNRWLCQHCLETTVDAIINRTVCPRCGQNRDLKTCFCDIVWDFPFTGIISFVDYSDIVKTMVHHIKYQGKRDLAFYTGSLCAMYLDKSIVQEIDMVIPIPLHWLRRRKRGYNQAEWFARGLFNDGLSGKITTNLLRRTRQTRTQTSLDKKDRGRNVAGAFSLTAQAQASLHAKRILLVDDVITTGATVAAATSTLLSGGCAEVLVMSFARD